MTGHVRRDSFGIPYLRAGSVLDLARLQGQVTAEDRAWQLEWFRWRMEGRTAEYVGAPGLPWDRFARQVRLEPTVRACFESLDDETRAWLDAYVDGVNDRMPLGLVRAPEADLLGLGEYAAAPRPWEPWTPLGIFWAVHLLFGTFPTKLFNDHVVRTLGPQWLPLFRTEGVEQSGSNAWVVTGERTASGLPLIGGDPHRTLEVPGCYQQIGLACEDFDVLGFAFPGVPGVQHFAHAGSVAWGITNAMADYQDLTREHLRRGPGNRLEARGIDGWQPVESDVATVVVRDAEPVDVPVVMTGRGPVVTGLDEGLEAALARGPEGPGAPCFSLRTPSQVGLDLGFGAFLPLLRSRTVGDVEAALARWVEPVNSALVADSHGQVRHLVVGRVPERAEANLRLPVDAWDPLHAWTGWRQAPASPVGSSASTSRADGTVGVMVSANDRASGGGLGVDYASPFRASRIREMLGERQGLTVDDFRRISLDSLNGQSRLMRDLVGAAHVAGEVAGGAAAVRDELFGWDGHSDVDSRGAAVFAAWRHALVQWISEHPSLERLHEPTGHSQLFTYWLTVPRLVGIGWGSMAAGLSGVGVDVHAGVVAALEQVALEEVAFEEVARQVAKEVAKEAGEAAGEVVSRDGPTVWGDLHRLRPIHALEARASAGNSPVMDVAVPGDKGCVLAASSVPGVSDYCSVGPAARYVWDLADRAASRWVVPLGASGIWGDDHFADQLPHWLSGGFLQTAPTPVQE